MPVLPPFSRVGFVEDTISLYYPRDVSHSLERVSPLVCLLSSWRLISILPEGCGCIVLRHHKIFSVCSSSYPAIVCCSPWMLKKSQDPLLFWRLLFTVWFLTTYWLALILSFPSSMWFFFGCCFDLEKLQFFLLALGLQASVSPPWQHCKRFSSFFAIFLCFFPAFSL